MTGLYIHVPICISRCRYCDFYKVTPNEWDHVALFIQSLEAEFRRLPSDFTPDTVFIGGGTPTALEPNNLATLFDALHRTINLSNVVEFTSEANPGTLTPEKLAILRAGGVNRVSIGVQSFNDKALRLLGRIHKADQAIDGYRMLRDAGFENVNIDLIQSIPGMTPDDILADARIVAGLEPEHISYYNLIYEPGTPMTHDRDTGRIVPPGDDEEADNYFAVKHLLEGAGYGHYETSNFSKPRKECLHNVLYWQGGEYFGCGPSAHSHWQGARYGNIRDLQGYCDRLLKNEAPFDEVERLSPEDKARETLVMWLRMTDGVDLAQFEQLTGFAIEALCGAAVDGMVDERLLQRSENRLALAKEALFISNSVFSELL
ncbi:MAG: radical SAM family heme chaperone HemW [Kiritimatiellales bacterium]|nr:radical SAM family heme chaperone HemW [Kiritimatiellales bacterium]MCF7864496.1 radical SAM family heme chaperone HemW [Kiritimatiellales bacterium]